MSSSFKDNWDEFLKKKFGDNIPEKFVVNLADVDFPIPPVMATTTEGFKSLARHNQKVGVFQ